MHQILILTAIILLKWRKLLRSIYAIHIVVYTNFKNIFNYYDVVCGLF